MKKIIIVLNVVLLMSLSSFGQQKDVKKGQNTFEDEKPATEQRSPGKKSGGNSVAETEDSDNILLESGSSLDAKLLSTLDVRKSKVGDEVVLKTTKSIKQDGEVVIPKGTKLIGRVTEVKRKTDENKTSSLSMVFESIQNKDLSAPITATVVSITNAKGSATAGQLFGADAMGSSSSSGGVSSGSSSGGGLLGGATSTVGGVLNTTTSTVGGVTNTAGSTVGGATQTLGGTLNGIRINQSASASASGSSTLTAENKNIRLEKGTQFQLQLTESIQN